MEKKKTKREKEKYQALSPTVNLKSRYEEIMDINEYFNELPEKAKQWMNDFTEEYVNASFKKGKKPLHKTKKQKKACYDRNNARNRDVLTNQKVTGNLKYIDDLKKKEELVFSEDAMISKIDQDREEQK